MSKPPPFLLKLFIVVFHFSFVAVPGPNPLILQSNMIIVSIILPLVLCFFIDLQHDTGTG